MTFLDPNLVRNFDCRHRTMHAAILKSGIGIGAELERRPVLADKESVVSGKLVDLHRPSRRSHGGGVNLCAIALGNVSA